MSDDHILRLLGAALDYRAAYHHQLATFAEEYGWLDANRRGRIEQARERITTANDALLTAALALEEGDTLAAPRRLPTAELLSRVDLLREALG